MTPDRTRNDFVNWYKTIENATLLVTDNEIQN